MPATCNWSEQALATFFDLDRQEVAVLATALAMLGFSVVAAILLMRTRVRAANNEARLRSELRSLQVEADRFRALLFAEPQVLVSWAAGDNRPQISGDISLLMPQDVQQSPQRILAFGTLAVAGAALQMDHAVNALREAGEGFLLTSPRPPAVPSKRWAAPSAARPSSGFASSAACAGNSPK